MRTHLIPLLKDNYAFVLRADAGDEAETTLVVDPSEAAPVAQFLDEKNWRPTAILNTHHHWDHVGGNAELVQRFQCSVYCHESDRDRVPHADHFVKDGDLLNLSGLHCKVLHIPGHTTGQVAYWFESANSVFVGDTLFGYGCGRLFEGSAEQMFHSLQKLKGLPTETMIYCGHEYTHRNLQFCIEVLQDPYYQRPQFQEELLQSGVTVPRPLEKERRDNPFLRAGTVREFTELRRMRDGY